MLTPLHLPSAHHNPLFDGASTCARGAEERKDTVIRKETLVNKT